MLEPALGLCQAAGWQGVLLGRMRGAGKGEEVCSYGLSLDVGQREVPETECSGKEENRPVDEWEERDCGSEETTFGPRSK